MDFLMLNAGLGGKKGNSRVLLELLGNELKASGVANVTVLDLEESSSETVLHALAAADGIVFSTGTYWDSWSSHLQKFLESATATEGTSLWLGKPAGVIVTMHSVGGKGVLSRLQGVLNTFGCLIPPMSGLVYSWVNQEVLAQQNKGLGLDLWRPKDLKIVAHNLVLAAKTKGTRWKSWEVDRGDVSARWIE